MDIGAVEVISIDGGPREAEAEALIWEFLQWGNDGLRSSYGIDVDIRALLEDDLRRRRPFARPTGRLLLVLDDDGSAQGVGGLRTLRPGTGEIKRMYVRPVLRQRGAGGALLDRLCEEAIDMDMTTLRLDSPRFLEAAHRLYRRRGFREIAPYPESFVPPQYLQHWLYMELDLQP